MITEEFWDFIEKYLPFYHDRDDVLRISELQLYIDGHISTAIGELSRNEAEDELHHLLYNVYIQAIDSYTKGSGIECEHCNIHKTKYCPCCGKRTDNDIIEDPYRCADCGSLDVQELAWINRNTGKYKGIVSIEERDRWCVYCDNNTLQVKESELLEDIQNWWEQLDCQTMETITNLKHESFINETDQDKAFGAACNKYWEDLNAEQKISFWKHYNYDQNE